MCLCKAPSGRAGQHRKKGQKWWPGQGLGISWSLQRKCFSNKEIRRKDLYKCVSIQCLKFLLRILWIHISEQRSIIWGFGPLILFAFAAHLPPVFELKLDPPIGSIEWMIQKQASFCLIPSIYAKLLYSCWTNKPLDVKNASVHCVFIFLKMS